VNTLGSSGDAGHQASSSSGALPFRRNAHSPKEGPRLAIHGRASGGRRPALETGPRQAGVRQSCPSTMRDRMPLPVVEPRRSVAPQPRHREPHIQGYTSHLKRVSISQAKNSLSAVLSEVRRGETVLVTLRGKPIAQISPIDLGSLTDEAAARLIEEGIARPPSSRLDLPWLRGANRPRPPERRSASRLISEERRENR